MSSDLRIKLQSGMIDCSLCGAATEFRWGVPTFNGDVVSNDFPDELLGQGGSVPVCERCFRAHAEGRLETWDHFYIHQAAANLIGGAGI